MDVAKREMPVLKTSAVRAHGNILIIEDSMDTAETVALFLMREGYGVRSVPSRNDALLVLDSYLYDIILMDHMMPGLGAQEFLKEARHRCPRSKIILMTAGHVAKEQAEKLGITQWLGKPFELNALLQSIEKTC